MDEKIYECEAKKLFLRNGRKRWEWVVVAVKDGLALKADFVRCKDCHGKVRLHDKKVEAGPAPHAEHRSRADSEYCPAGMYFRQNPGRASQLSQSPVE